MDFNISEEEQDGYYYGLANEGLWPLCHIAFVRPTFRQSDWDQYRAVNARFARAVIEEADRSDPIVMVQDYHFALLPRLIGWGRTKLLLYTGDAIDAPTALSWGLVERVVPAADLDARIVVSRRGGTRD